MTWIVVVWFFFFQLSLIRLHQELGMKMSLMVQVRTRPYETICSHSFFHSFFPKLLGQDLKRVKMTFFTGHVVLDSRFTKRDHETSFPSSFKEISTPCNFGTMKRMKPEIFRKINPCFGPQPQNLINLPVESPTYLSVVPLGCYVANDGRSFRGQWSDRRTEQICSQILSGLLT